MLEWPPDPKVLENLRRKAYKEWEQGPDRWVFNWFSNFLPLRVPINHQDREYITIEHWYQAMKSHNPDYRDAIAKCETPNKTKFLAHRLRARDELREDWFEINIDVMTYGQRHRIETDPEFYDKLRATRGEYIIEWNNWTDLFWGASVYTGQGQNVLGRILMNLRDNVYWPEKGG